MWAQFKKQLATSTQVYEQGETYFLPDKQAKKFERKGLVEILAEPPEDDFPFEIEYKLIEQDGTWTIDDSNFDKSSKADYSRANQAIESALRNLNAWRGESNHTAYGLASLGGEYIFVGPTTPQAKNILIQAALGIWEFRKPTYRVFRTENLVGTIWWTIDTSEFSHRREYHAAASAASQSIKNLHAHVILHGTNTQEPSGEYQLVHTEATGYCVLGEPANYRQLKDVLLGAVNRIWHDGRLPPYPTATITT